VNKSFPRISGGKFHAFRPLVIGGGLDTLAIYQTTAGGQLPLSSGTKYYTNHFKSNSFYV
jgi:hypothetical protein